MAFLDTLPAHAIIAHRGASAYAPENTLAAFKLAVEQNADAIELDAKLSSDSHIVVIHDQTVDRTTGHTGRVNKLTLAALKELDAGSFFDPCYQAEKIPTLEEVLVVVGQKILINIELTNYSSITDKLPEHVADLVLKYRLQQRVLFSSFNPIALWRVRRLIPEAPIGLLAFPGFSGAWARSWPGRWIGYDSLHPEKKDVTADLVKQTHRRTRKIITYTVNLEEEIRRLYAFGVDGIFTDDPLLARQIRDTR